MYWRDGGMGAWGFTLVTISIVLFWALMIIAAVALIRYIGRSQPTHPAASPEHRKPEQILAERFARGEIDQDELRRGLDALRGPPAPPSPPT